MCGASPTRRAHPIGVIASRALLAVAGVALGLVVAELLARALAPQWKPPWAERATYWRHDPLLGWSHKPGLRGVYSGPGFRARVAINSRGLRDREHALERAPQGETRVLLLGDSFGWGYGVDQDSTLAARLDREPGLEAINASVSGYCTTQQLLWYRREGRHYRPDLVLILVCGNDLGDNPGPSLYWYRKPYFDLSGDSLALRGVPVPEPTLADRVHMFVVGRTYLGSGLRAAWWALQARRGGRAATDTATATGSARATGAAAEPAATDSTAYRLTGAILRAFAREARGDGSRLALALIPMDAALTAWWKQAAAADSIPVLDLRAGVGTTSEVQLPGDTHWNALGNARAAAALGPWLGDVLPTSR